MERLVTQHVSERLWDTGFRQQRHIHSKMLQTPTLRKHSQLARQEPAPRIGLVRAVETSSVARIVERYGGQERGAAAFVQELFECL